MKLGKLGVLVPAVYGLDWVGEGRGTGKGGGSGKEETGPGRAEAGAGAWVVMEFCLWKVIQPYFSSYLVA